MQVKVNVICAQHRIILHFDNWTILITMDRKGEQNEAFQQDETFAVINFVEVQARDMFSELGS